ncbi:helix-turn-helix domain-containing protein [Niallia endozanthoxylica]|uniref:Helix-turn-helix domain-containing protein n=1 Tax=Niallia endozanthoxylica TaxID=2036016 RepID=A0A5J5HVW5_9BACI|nr:helix-turn-helix domain-containing protein [Niallia endozanthoxylica]
MTELGNRLKEARLEKGLSLDDLQEATKIQKRYLVGIEEGNYSAMPGKFYVRAFIKQYAEAVGLEPEAVFEEFNNEIPSILSEDIPGQLSRVQTKKTISENGSKVLDLLPKILIGVLVIGVFVFIWYLAQKYSGNDGAETAPKESKQEITYEESADLSNERNEDQQNQTNEKENAEDTQQENDKNKEEEKDNPVQPSQELNVVEANGDQSIYELTNTETFQLKVVSTGETWVNIKNNKGYSFFQGMLKKGETESQTLDMSQETEVVIVAGNSTATEIFINDQKLEYAVAPAEVVRQDIIIRYVKNNQ